MALGPSDDGMNAGNQLFAVEGLADVIVGAKAEGLNLALRVVTGGQDRDRRVFRSSRCAMIERSVELAHRT